MPIVRSPGRRHGQPQQRHQHAWPTRARTCARRARCCPREAWQTVNDLHLYVGANAVGGVERRSRARFLSRVISDGQQLDGVMTTTMNRDEAYELWRLGESIERADMTTRVVGVRAAALLAEGWAQLPDDGQTVAEVHDDVQWMGLLRSVSALQMYQRVDPRADRRRRRGQVPAARTAVPAVGGQLRRPRSARR